MVWYAAHAQDAAPEEARIMALQAKAHLGEVGREVARLATEVHGGMGLTDFLGLHYWLKRIASIVRCWVRLNAVGRKQRPKPCRY